MNQVTLIMLWQLAQPHRKEVSSLSQTWQFDYTFLVTTANETECQ